MIIDIVKVFLPSTVAFAIGILLTPFLTHYLYRYRAWKKSPGKHSLDGSVAVEFNKLHQDTEAKTPRMGGIVIWASSLLTITGIWLLARVMPVDPFAKLDFLSRDQTWIPLVMLLTGALIGLINDILDVTQTGPKTGLPVELRLGFIVALSGIIGWWFYAKLGVASVSAPFLGTIALGPYFIPFFILVAIALYASGTIDGIDGLSGGVFAAIFSAYAGIAFYQGQINLAAFSAMLVGSILAFLWFNIPPARFWMTETGTMGLTLALTGVVFMTDVLGEGRGVSVLPIIALPLVATVLSNVIQVASKRLRGKKVFRIAPLHHHFEAIGWPGYKVTMRYWVISVICALLGLSIALI